MSVAEALSPARPAVVQVVRGMTHPWDDPEATGFSRLVSADESRALIHHTIESFEKERVSVLGAASGHLDVILTFARRYDLHTTRHAVSSGRETWGLTGEYDRMNRRVGILIERAAWVDGSVLEVRSEAYWVKRDPDEIFTTSVERRWFGLTDESPPETLEDSLELAFSDAKSYSTSELTPFDEARHRLRPS